MDEPMGRNEFRRRRISRAHPRRPRGAADSRGAVEHDMGVVMELADRIDRAGFRARLQNGRRGRFRKTRGAEGVSGRGTRYAAMRTIPQLFLERAGAAPDRLRAAKYRGIWREITPMATFWRRCVPCARPRLNGYSAAMRTSPSSARTSRRFLERVRGVLDRKQVISLILPDRGRDRNPANDTTRFCLVAQEQEHVRQRARDSRRVPRRGDDLLGRHRMWSINTIAYAVREVLRTGRARHAEDGNRFRILVAAGSA